MPKIGFSKCAYNVFLVGNPKDNDNYEDRCLILLVLYDFVVPNCTDDRTYADGNLIL